MQLFKTIIDFLESLEPKAMLVRYTTACLLAFVGIFIGIYAGLWLIKEIATL